ncbi:MAG: BamA/TamA family outer membrane protein [Armatimonadota bacterium]
MRLTALYTLLVFIFLAQAIAQDETVAPVTVYRNVERIEFTGNTVISSDELLKIVGIKPGQLLTNVELSRGVQAITDAYRDRGYLAVVTGDIVAPFQETGVLRIPITEVHVSEVRIEGLQRTKEFAVRRLLEVQPGVLYSVAALRRDAERLFALNIFESVNARLAEADEPGKIVVVWELVERKRTGFITVGGSYSSRDNLVGSVTVTESNLQGLAEQIRLTANVNSLDARLGGELLYYTPWVAPKTSMTLRAFDLASYRFGRDLVNGTDIDRYYERGKGGQALFTRSLTNVRRLVGGIRYENLNVANLPVQLFIGNIPSQDGTVAAISGEYVTDLRDSVVYPTHGLLWRAVLEPGRVNLDDNGDNWITKGSVEIRRFFALDRIPVLPGQAATRRPRVIATRLMAGTTVGDLPFFEQYFIGGLGSLRGYIEGRFWGDNMALATVEYRQPFGRSFTGVAFVDAGDAWGSDFQFQPGVDTDFKQHKGFSPRAGVGVGVRYTSEIGSFGLDFAWGEEFRTHITLGDTF